MHNITQVHVDHDRLPGVESSSPTAMHTHRVRVRGGRDTLDMVDDNDNVSLHCGIQRDLHCPVRCSEAPDLVHGGLGDRGVHPLPILEHFNKWLTTIPKEQNYM